MDDFHNIHKYHRSDVTNTHDIAHFVTILLKALPDVIPILFCNPDNQEKNVYNEEGIDANIIISNAYSFFFPHLWLNYTR